jgi:PIN domain nuclease of toxin-antitoxin system
LTVALLDTHVLIGLLEGSERLGSESRAFIQAASRNDSLFVSAISPWEMAMWVSKGRLALDRDVGEWLRAAFALPGIRLVPLLLDIAVASTRLPGEIHPDPADRIIVATARHLGAVLVTEDRLLLDYSVMDYVKARRAGS